jgi:hypothetical protein
MPAGLASSVAAVVEAGQGQPHVVQFGTGSFQPGLVALIIYGPVIHIPVVPYRAGSEAGELRLGRHGDGWGQGRVEPAQELVQVG